MPTCCRSCPAAHSVATAKHPRAIAAACPASSTVAAAATCAGCIAAACRVMHSNRAAVCSLWRLQLKLPCRHRVCRCTLGGEQLDCQLGAQHAATAAANCQLAATLRAGRLLPGRVCLHSRKQLVVGVPPW